MTQALILLNLVLFAKPFASFHYCKGIIKPEGSWLNSLKESREVLNLRSVIAFGETARVNMAVAVTKVRL